MITIVFNKKAAGDNRAATLKGVALEAIYSSIKFERHANIWKNVKMKKNNQL